MILLKVHLIYNYIKDNNVQQKYILNIIELYI